MNLSSIFKIIIIIFILSLMVLPINALDIQIRWNNAIITTAPVTMNGTLYADNSTYSWPASRNVCLEVERTGTNRNDRADLYVRASGNFTNGTNYIDLANFKYSDYGGVIVTPRSFTTTNTLVRANWTRNGATNRYLPVDLTLTVPFGTAPGLYNTTIIHVIVFSGSLPSLSSMGGQILDDNTTDNSTEGNNTTQNLEIYL